MIQLLDKHKLLRFPTGYYCDGNFITTEAVIYDKGPLFFFGKHFSFLVISPYICLHL